MHFVSAKVAVKMPFRRVLFILWKYTHFGRGFGPFDLTAQYKNV